MSHGSPSADVGHDGGHDLEIQAFDLLVSFLGYGSFAPFSVRSALRFGMHNGDVPSENFVRGGSFKPPIYSKLVL